jgi:hypothetical protein
MYHAVTHVASFFVISLKNVLLFYFTSHHCIGTSNFPVGLPPLKKTSIKKKCQKGTPAGGFPFGLNFKYIGGMVDCKQRPTRIPAMFNSGSPQHAHAHSLDAIPHLEIRLVSKRFSFHDSIYSLTHFVS